MVSSACSFLLLIGALAALATSAGPQVVLVPTDFSADARPAVDFAFELARRHVWLRFLVDTEYGSATYIEVRRPARFQVLVSTTGLLVREIALK